ncbi:hypothetical protein CK203_091476 [Vitis vinifera]|uniref:Uncharacterized protein n=1 Tax=Vitis vinifera TaxID=29760 RepID=A0A438CK38_VITVI|nr:hypothetical protein CK203_091476 [Vitis vinifera]
MIFGWKGSFSERGGKKRKKGSSVGLLEGEVWRKGRNFGLRRDLSGSYPLLKCGFCISVVWLHLSCL